MLSFFRKHQKGFFIVVTFFIVISFCFFGTYSAFSKPDKIPDREIGRLVDGSVLKEQKLHSLIGLLQNGVEEGGRLPNLLSDSMVHRDLILTGLGQILAEHHFDQIKGDLEERWKRAKHYSPYVHPYAPSISARNVWSVYSPKILTLLEALKVAPEEFSKEQLPLLFDLYVAQAEFPPQLMLQMLYYQQNSSKQIRPDQGLPQANVALFGFQSVSDWFGETFVEEIGKLILNSACIAREEGYKVSKEEAQIDLFSNVYRGMKTYGQNKNPSSEEAQTYFSQLLYSIGLDENQATGLWREVLYFKRLFDDVGNAVFVDSLAYNQFKDFAKPSHIVSTYQLPRSLQFQSFREMIKFQCYLEIVAADEFVNLPKSLQSAEDIMDGYPQLVYKEFELEVASVDKQEAAALMGLRQTWEWEGENFELLKREFPELASCKGETIDEKMEALEKLDEMTRFKVDQYARLALLDVHPEKIDETLAAARREKKRLKVTLREGESPLSGERFLALLEAEDPSLSHYSVDGETFYAIKVLEKGKGWNLHSFEEVNKRAAMDELLDQLLQAAYPAYDLEQPFEEAKDLVASKVYADLLQSIASHAKIEEFDDYAKHRFDGYLEEMHALAINNPLAFEEAQEGSWALEKREEQLALDDVEIAVGEFSSLSNGKFFKFIEKVENRASDSEIASVKERLKRDAEQEMLRKMLKRL